MSFDEYGTSLFRYFFLLCLFGDFFVVTGLKCYTAECKGDACNSFIPNATEVCDKNSNICYEYHGLRSVAAEYDDRTQSFTYPPMKAYNIRMCSNFDTMAGYMNTGMATMANNTCYNVTTGDKRQGDALFDGAHCSCYTDLCNGVSTIVAVAGPRYMQPRDTSSASAPNNHFLSIPLLFCVLRSRIIDLLE